jgi:hypothetical protein
MIRGIRLRLALALLAVVAGALGVAYVVVVPTLENRLVDATLEQLDQDAVTVRRCIEGYEFQDWQICADQGPAILNVRVVVYQVLSRDPPVLGIVADSQLGTSRDVERDEVARRATTTARVQHGTVTRGEDRFAEVAVPLAAQGPVFLLSSPLSDPL